MGLLADRQGVYQLTVYYIRIENERKKSYKGTLSNDDTSQ